MIHDRIIDFTTEAVKDIYLDDNEQPITREEYERALAQRTTGYTCPQCGAQTFGMFEPFLERGIRAWCSSCGYMVGDKKQIDAWIRAHPEAIEPEEYE